MLDILMAETICAERKASSLHAIYRQQSREFQSIERLEAQLRLSKERLGFARELAAHEHQDEPARRALQS
jgi:hypothetical protein